MNSQISLNDISPARITVLVWLPPRYGSCAGTGPSGYHLWRHRTKCGRQRQGVAKGITVGGFAAGSWHGRVGLH